ncbi:MAG: hypothetical protein LBH81_02230 [Rickettsiales bacterium]|nr:hypothetical protein [Rickettsiales bacterium]
MNTVVNPYTSSPLAGEPKTALRFLVGGLAALAIAFSSLPSPAAPQSIADCYSDEFFCTCTENARITITECVPGTFADISQVNIWMEKKKEEGCSTTCSVTGTIPGSRPAAAPSNTPPPADRAGNISMFRS